MVLGAPGWEFFFFLLGGRLMSLCFGYKYIIVSCFFWLALMYFVSFALHDFYIFLLSILFLSKWYFLVLFHISTCIYFLPWYFLSRFFPEKIPHAAPEAAAQLLLESGPLSEAQARVVGGSVGAWRVGDVGLL